MWTDDRVFFDKYEGFITTKLGPKATDEELEKVRKLFL